MDFTLKKSFCYAIYIFILPMSAWVAFIYFVTKYSVRISRCLAAIPLLLNTFY